MNSCSACGSELKPKLKKFCSRKCYYKHLDSLRGVCVGCGTQLKSNQYKYCSNKCQQDSKWKTISKSMDAGAIPRVSDNTDAKHLKRYLIEKNGQKCEICGAVEWNGQPVPVVLDHINGNAGANAFSNVRIICCNCDALLPTYKGRNRGNGRHSRRERYGSGKSY